MKLIRGFCCKHNQNNDKFYAVFNSIGALFINFQKNDQTIDKYLKEFQARMATLDDYDANIVGLVPCLIEETVKKMFDTTMNMTMEKEIEKAKEYVMKRGSAMSLLIGADRNRYGAMKNKMQQNMAMGTNNYPKSVDETMNILNTFAKTSKNTFEKKQTINLM